MPLRVLVCGGRDLRDRQLIGGELEQLDIRRGPISVLIHGCATGADSTAEAWARSRNVKTAGFRADWSQGKAGGPIRNSRMLAEGKPDLVIAFPGGSGTADMVRKARAAGVEVIEIRESAR